MDKLAIPLFAISLIAAYVIVNLVLAEFARRVMGNFYLWFVLFCLLPVISHMAFVVIRIVQVRKRGGSEAISDLMGRPERDTYSPDRGTRGAISVTPFDDRGKFEGSGADAEDAGDQQDAGS